MLAECWIRARDHPPVQHGGRVGMPQTPCLFAPADDRNALAMPTVGGIALAGQRPVQSNQALAPKVLKRPGASLVYRTVE